MTHDIRLTGRMIAAARVLADVSQSDFAAATGISIEVLQSMERDGGAWISSGSDVKAAHSGLEHFGVIIVEEADGMGAGVRLKFTRDDVRQIIRLEGEGGIVGSDDAP